MKQSFSTEAVFPNEVFLVPKSNQRAKKKREKKKVN